MGIPILSGLMKRLGKIGKLGLFLVLLGVVGSIAMSSIANPAAYDREPQINGRTVIPNESLINQPIGYVQMRVEARPSVMGAPYSIGIVPSYLTSNVQDKNDLENYAVAYERDIEGSVVISYSQMGGTEKFDIVVFSEQNFSMPLSVTYNIATGSFARPVIIVGVILMVLGIGLGYRSNRRLQNIFMDAYTPDGISEQESRTSHFGDTGTGGEYAVERMLSRHTAPEPRDSNGDLCHNCGEYVSKSDVLCPHCYIQL